jgi:hypothetical protein
LVDSKDILSKKHVNGLDCTISIKIKFIPKYRAGLKFNIYIFFYLGIRCFRLTARFFFADNRLVAIIAEK